MELGSLHNKGMLNPMVGCLLLFENCDTQYSLLDNEQKNKFSLILADMGQSRVNFHVGYHSIIYYSS